MQLKYAVIVIKFEKAAATFNSGKKRFVNVSHVIRTMLSRGWYKRNILFVNMFFSFRFSYVHVVTVYFNG